MTGDQRPLTAARTGVLVVPSVAMALAAHVLGGGCLEPAGVAIVAAVLSLSTWTQLSRPRSARFTLAWLTTTQVLAHGLLALSCLDGTTEPGRRLLPSPTALALHALVVPLGAYGCHRVDRWLCGVAQLASAVGTAARRVIASVRSRIAPRLPVRPGGSDWLQLPRLVAVSLPPPWAGHAPVRRGPPGALLRR